jgi:O-antigen/teichoic acid export membrane protein
MATASLNISAEADLARGEQLSKPGEELTQRAYLNAVAALLDYGAKAAVASLVMPIVVSGLGPSLFGIWLILSKLVTYISAADGRPTQALKFVIANQQSIEDPAAKRRHVGSALAVWLIFLPILTALSSVVVWFAPIITKVPPPLYGTVRLSCALLVVNFLLTNLIALPESVLRGMNLGYKRMGLQASMEVVGGVLMAGAIYFGSGLVGVSVAQVILTGFTGVMFWVVVRKFVSWFGIARPSMAEVRSFLGISNWWFAWSSITKLMIASDVVILGVVASASMVTTYTLTSYASLTLLSGITIVIGAVTPGLGGIIGLKNYERAARLRDEMMTTSWLLVTASGSTILLWNRSFISLWVGAKYYAGFWPNLLIVLVMAQLVFIRNQTYVIDLTLKMRRKVIVGTVALALSICLSTLLIPPLGITGLCLGILGGRLLLTIYYPLLVNSYLGSPKRQLLRANAQRGLSLGLLFAGSAYLGEHVDVHHWIEWIIGTGITFGLMLLVAFVIGLKADERVSLSKRIRTIRAFRTVS